MKIILIKDIDKLGAVNEIVTVKAGYARNFLIPNKIAIEASPQNLAKAQQHAKAKTRKEDELLKEIKVVRAKLTEAPLELTAKTGTSGKIFGSITSMQIARAIKEQKGYEIDRKRIVFKEDIKDIGEHIIEVNLGEENTFDVNLNITAEA